MVSTKERADVSASLDKITTARFVFWPARPDQKQALLPINCMHRAPKNSDQKDMIGSLATSGYLWWLVIWGNSLGWAWTCTCIFVPRAILPRLPAEGESEVESSTSWVSVWVWAYRWCYSGLSLYFPKGGCVSWTLRVKEPFSGPVTFARQTYRVSTDWDLGLPSKFCMSLYRNCDTQLAGFQLATGIQE